MTAIVLPAYAADESPGIGAVSQPWVCVLCGTSKTPMKRNHPVHGPKTLCNACGVRLSRRVKADKGKGSGGTSSGIKARSALRQACVKTYAHEDPPRTRTDRKRTERALQALDMDSSDDAGEQKRARITARARAPRCNAGSALLPEAEKELGTYNADEEDMLWLDAFNAPGACAASTESDLSTASECTAHPPQRDPMCSHRTGSTHIAPPSARPAHLCLDDFNRSMHELQCAASAASWELTAEDAARVLRSGVGLPQAVAIAVYEHWARKAGTAAPGGACMRSRHIGHCNVDADEHCRRGTALHRSLSATRLPHGPPSHCNELSFADGEAWLLQGTLEEADIGYQGLFSVWDTQQIDEDRDAHESLLGASLVVRRETAIACDSGAGFLQGPLPSDTPASPGGATTSRRRPLPLSPQPLDACGPSFIVPNETPMAQRWKQVQERCKEQLPASTSPSPRLPSDAVLRDMESPFATAKGMSSSNLGLSAVSLGKLFSSPPGSIVQLPEQSCLPGSGPQYLAVVPQQEVCACLLPRNQSVVWSAVAGSAAPHTCPHVTSPNLLSGVKRVSVDSAMSESPSALSVQPASMPFAGGCKEVFLRHGLQASGDAICHERALGAQC